MRMIDIISPIETMMFGKHKGKTFWTLGPNYFNWLSSQDISPATVNTIEAARQLYDNEGCFAVFKKNKYGEKNTILVIIVSSRKLAEARLEPDDYTWHWFIYNIQSTEKKYRDNTFPDIDDYQTKPKY
mgnify:CR=1 FL=1